MSLIENPQWQLFFSKTISEDNSFVALRLFRTVGKNFIGGIGHVSMIVDAAKNRSGSRVYLIGYGFIPAQEFHLQKAREGYGIDGWFTKKGYEKYLSEFPFYRYGAPVIRRFD